MVIANVELEVVPSDASESWSRPLRGLADSVWRRRQSGIRSDQSGTPPQDPVQVAFASLAPAVLPPPPPDSSNRWADDPAAARFGQSVFFDAGFAGALLDSDNLGDDHSLGMAGETGKVPCAGCHVPAAGFVDVRSPRQTISLAAGWGGAGPSPCWMWVRRRS